MVEPDSQDGIIKDKYLSAWDSDKALDRFKIPLKLDFVDDRLAGITKKRLLGD